MKWWPFPLLRNHATSEALTRLFLDFADRDLEVRAGPHYTTVKCELGEINFWSSNAYYAWAQDGVFTNAAGERAVWNHQMPSRYAVRKMAKRVGEFQFVY